MKEHDQVKRMLDQLKDEANPALPTTAVHSFCLNFPGLVWTNKTTGMLKGRYTTKFTAGDAHPLKQIVVRYMEILWIYFK